MVTVSEFLRSRREELQRLIAEKERELAPLRAELVQVRKALEVVSNQQPDSLYANQLTFQVEHWYAQYSPALIANMTLKDMVRLVLLHEFRQGATALQLVDFFERAWGRIVPRSSLSPQLSRLKESGEIDLRGNVWVLQGNLPAESAARPITVENVTD